MRPDADIRAFARLLREPDSPLEETRATPEGLALAIYRRLLRDRLASAVEATLPRTTRLLGVERLHEIVDLFVKECGSRSPYFRDVSGEVIRFSLPHLTDRPGLAPFFADVARLELASFEVGISDADHAAPPAPLELDRPVRLSLACRLLDLDHAVHRDPSDSAPARAHSRVLVYRDPSTKRVHQLELTEAAARILSRLQTGALLRVAIAAGLADAAVPPSDLVLSETAAMLADLAQRGVVKGAMPDGMAPISTTRAV